MKNFIFRRKILVDKKFQTSFITYSLIVLLVIIIITSVLIIYSTSRQITGSVYSKIVQLKDTKEIIIPSVIKIGIIILLLAGGFLLFNLLMYTHRIVGPMVRFKRCLKNLGNGDFTTFIKFREKDKMQELGNILSASAKKLNKSVVLINKNFNIIKKIALNKSLKKLSKKEMVSLKKSIDNIDIILKSFKTN